MNHIQSGAAYTFNPLYFVEDLKTDRSRDDSTKCKAQRRKVIDEMRAQSLWERSDRVATQDWPGVAQRVT